MVCGVNILLCTVYYNSSLFSVSATHCTADSRPHQRGGERDSGPKIQCVHIKKAKQGQAKVGYERVSAGMDCSLHRNYVQFSLPIPRQVG